MSPSSPLSGQVGTFYSILEPLKTLAVTIQVIKAFGYELDLKGQRKKCLARGRLNVEGAATNYFGLSAICRVLLLIRTILCSGVCDLISAPLVDCVSSPKNSVSEIASSTRVPSMPY